MSKKGNPMMERHRIENCTSLPLETLQRMAWELTSQNRISRNDIPEDFRGTTIYASGAYTKTVTDYGGALGSRTVYATA